MELNDSTTELRRIFQASVTAVSPKLLMSNIIHTCENSLVVCDNNGKEYAYTLNKNIVLIGFGKAVYEMAWAVDEKVGCHIREGVISVPRGTLQERYSQRDFCFQLQPNIRVMEGAFNNVTDVNAIEAGKAMLHLVQTLKNDDILVTLISGGGSSLFPVPLQGLKIEDKIRVVEELKCRGASIHQLNCVRSALSLVKGGKLVHMCPKNRIISFILSDVVGDGLDVVASGPTVAPLHRNPHKLAIDILRSYSVSCQNIIDIISQYQPSQLSTTWDNVQNILIGNIDTALAAANITARTCGFQSIILSSQVEGSVPVVAEFYEKIICQIILYFSKSNSDCENDEKLTLLQNIYSQIPNAFPFMKDARKALMQNLPLFNKNAPVCLLCGGEPTVIVTGKGQGGRNQELVLTLASKLSALCENQNVLFLSAGTDGIDGPTDVAGALFNKALYSDKTVNFDPWLLNNDSYGFFSKYGGGKYFVKTGHTGTNVMDVHIILIKL